MNTQQAYLFRAAELICVEFSLKLNPASVIYSYGFPKGRGGRGRIIGQCWHAPKPSGYAGAIFVHPCQWKTAHDVLHVLLHEILHAEHPDAGHKGEFVKACKAVGLVKPWTATTAGPELTTRLNKMAEALGEFPKADFSVDGKGKRPGSRLRLWECGCGVKVRVASDDFDATCGGCGDKFEMQ